MQTVTLYPWPPTVTVVRTRFDGTVDREPMNALLACWSVMHDPALGLVYRSARIEWGDVVDLWGQSA